MKYVLNRQEVSREEFMAGKKGIDFKGGKVMSRLSTTWPMYSDAAGTSEHQIKEATEEATRLGVPTSFDREGRAIFNSPGHRAKYLRAVGMYDRDAGYGDPAPNNL